MRSSRVLQLARHRGAGCLQLHAESMYVCNTRTMGSQLICKTSPGRNSHEKRGNLQTTASTSSGGHMPLPATYGRSSAGVAARTWAMAGRASLLALRRKCGAPRAAPSPGCPRLSSVGYKDGYVLHRQAGPKAPQEHRRCVALRQRAPPPARTTPAASQSYGSDAARLKRYGASSTPHCGPPHHPHIEPELSERAPQPWLTEGGRRFPWPRTRATRCVPVSTRPQGRGRRRVPGPSPDRAGARPRRNGKSIAWTYTRSDCR
jgi:hypothetical protein